MSTQKTAANQTHEASHKHEAAKPVAPQSAELTPAIDLAALPSVMAAPRLARPVDVLMLQRTAGNRAVTRLIQTRQPGRPAVVPQAVQRQTEEEEDDLQMKPLAASITPLVQRQAAEEEEEELQAKPEIQRASSGAGFEVSGDFEQQLAASRGGGSPLSAEVRAFMEPRFGADFRGVRLHTGSDAARLNREVSAQAFTYGRDIYLSEGKTDVSSVHGRQLLAHELTHVVQQSGGPVVSGGLAPVQRIQRTSTTGLAATAATEGFAQEAYDYWKATPTKTRAEFAQDMIAKLNAKLLYPVTTVITTSGDSGVFSRSAATFAIKVNAAGFSKRTGLSSAISDLTQAEVGEVVDTLYHEARHAEQILRIAQMQAGQGKLASQIATALSIPPAAAAEAVKTPLDATKPENATLISEAEAWGAFMGGKYETYKKEVANLRDEIAALQTALDGSTTANVIANVGPKLTTIETRLTTFFDPKKEEIDALADKKPFDTEVSQRIDAIRQAFDNFKAEYGVQQADATKISISKLKSLRSKLHGARYDAYRAYEHEKDAWAVGGAAGTKFKALTATTPTTAPTTP
jgi:hypothetical protein